MRIHWLGITLVLFATCMSESRGQSQSTPEIDQQKTGQTQPAVADTRGTEQSPLVVKIAPIPKTAGDRDDEAKERDRLAKAESQKEKSDADLVKYTAELAAFTKGLFYATAGLVVATLVLGIMAIIQSRDMKASIAVATLAANAADLSAKAAIGIELPILRVNNLGLDLLSIEADTNLEGPYACLVNDDLPTQHSAISEIPFHNFGRTLAFIVKLDMGFAVADTLPAVPVYDRTFARPPGVIMAVGVTTDFEIPYAIHLTDEQFARIGDGTANLWIYCSLHYRDFLDNPHQVGFCWRWGQEPPGEGIFGFITDRSSPPEYTIYN
jgi:hypothetical protein